MMFTYDGGRDTISEYRIETVSGYTLGLNLFYTRLEELREVRQKIQALESAKPNF